MFFSFGKHHVLVCSSAHFFFLFRFVFLVAFSGRLFLLRSSSGDLSTTFPVRRFIGTGTASPRDDTITTLEPEHRRRAIISFPPTIDCGDEGQEAKVETPLYRREHPRFKMCVHRGRGCRSIEKKEVVCHTPQDVVSQSIFKLGSWEVRKCETIASWGRAFMSTAKQKWWFVDAGANIGFLSLCGFERLPTLSVEAAPWNFFLLNKTRAIWTETLNAVQGAAIPNNLGGGLRNSVWKTVNVALSNVSGESISMVGGAGNFGGSSLVKPENHPRGAKGNASGGWMSGATTTHIQTALLDDVVDTYLGPATSPPAGLSTPVESPAGGEVGGVSSSSSCIAILKLDVEGFEYFAMQGAKRLLRERPPCKVLMEFHTELLRAAGGGGSAGDSSPGDLLDLFVQAGYASRENWEQKWSGGGDVLADIVWDLVRPPQNATKCRCPREV